MTTPVDSTDKKRLDELMPWYVNGRIGAEDRAWVEARLAESEAARAELEWHQFVADGVHQEVAALPADPGLQQVLQRIHAEQAKPAPIQIQASLLARLAEAWSAFARGPAFAVAAVLVVAQAAVITVLMSHDNGTNEYGQMRSLGAPVAGGGPALQITFAATAAERDLRQLLLQVGGRFVDGPDQFGAYVVSVAPERFETARQLLERDARVASLTVIDRFVSKH
jgi:anti-sigma factor RsiW